MKIFRAWEAFAGIKNKINHKINLNNSKTFLNKCIDNNINGINI